MGSNKFRNIALTIIIILLVILILQNYFTSYNSQKQLDKDEPSKITTKTPPVPKDGLIAYYPFNGNANDESGNENNGDTGGDIHYINGIVGSALQVRSHSTGSDCDNDLGGNVLLPNFHFRNMSSFTYSLWVRDKEITCGTAAYIYFRDTTYGIPYAGITRNVSSIHFMAGLNSVNDVIVAPFLPSYSDSFTHYCLVYDNGITTAYINGNAVESKQQPLNVDGLHSAIARSWYSNNTSTRLTATIDEVRIYKKALSDTEVQQLFNMK